MQHRKNNTIVVEDFAVWKDSVEHEEASSVGNESCDFQNHRHERYCDCHCHLSFEQNSNCLYHC